jgi:hypothetical protein
MTDDELFVLFCIAVGSFLTWVTTGLVLWITVKNTKKIYEIDRDLRELETVVFREAEET